MANSKKLSAILFMGLVVAGLLFFTYRASETPPPPVETPPSTGETTAIPETPATPTAKPAESAISTPRPSDPEVADKDIPPTITFISGSGDPLHITMLNGVRQSAGDAGIEVIARIPETFDPDVQIPLIEEMTARGDIGYIIVAPADRDRLIPVLERAHRAGIFVITVDAFIGDGDYENGPVTFPLSHIGSDNFRGGFNACEALADMSGEGAGIYIENVRPGISSTDQREAGCRAATAAAGLEVVGVGYSEDKVDLARTHTLVALAENPDIGGIFGTNAAGARGAAIAVREADMDRVKVVAFDATEFAVGLLRKGQVSRIIAQKPFDMGYMAVAIAVAHAKGFRSVPPRLTTGYAVMDIDNIEQPETARFFYSSVERALKPPLKDLTLAFVPGTGAPFYITMHRGAGAAADLYGINLVRADPAAFNPEAQVPVIETILEENDVDYLITVPTDKDALIPVLRNIHDSGIPVITADNFIGDGNYEVGPVTFPITYIGSDNIAGGYLACSILALSNITGKGAAMYIQNIRPGISTTDLRAKGCMAAARDFGLDIVAVDYADTTGTGNSQDFIVWSREHTRRALADNPNIVGVFGVNGYTAQGAGEAVVESGLGGAVEVASFDASTWTVELLRKRTVTQVVAQKPADMGYFAVLAAIAHARGVGSFPARWVTGFAVINNTNMDDPNFTRFIYQNE